MNAGLHRWPAGSSQNLAGSGLRLGRPDQPTRRPRPAPSLRVVFVVGWLAVLALLLMLGLSGLLVPFRPGEVPSGPVPSGMPQVSTAAPR